MTHLENTQLLLLWISRLPDPQGAVDGTPDQAKDHFCTSLRVTEGLVSQVREQETQSLVLRRRGHAMDADGQGIGLSVRLNVNTGVKKTTHQRAGLYTRS